MFNPDTKTLELTSQEAGVFQAGLNALVRSGQADLAAAEAITVLNQRLIKLFATENGSTALEAPAAEEAAQ